MRNPSRKLWEVFTLINLQVIRIHLVVCLKRGMRIFVLIIPQVIRMSYLKFDEWQVVAVLVVYRPKRRVKLFSRVVKIYTPSKRRYVVVAHTRAHM